MWRQMLGILALGRLRQELHYFRATLGYILSPYLASFHDKKEVSDFGAFPTLRLLAGATTRPLTCAMSRPRCHPQVLLFSEAMKRRVKMSLVDRQPLRKHDLYMTSTYPELTAQTCNSSRHRHFEL